MNKSLQSYTKYMKYATPPLFQRKKQPYHKSYSLRAKQVCFYILPSFYAIWEYAFLSDLHNSQKSSNFARFLSRSKRDNPVHILKSYPL